LPYMQAASTTPIGFVPNGGYPIMEVGEYVVATSFASAIFIGDPVTMTSSSPIHGSVTNVYTSANYNKIVGVAAESLAASVGSTAFKVYNDLRQRFMVRANLESTGGTTNIIGSALIISTAGTSNSTIDRSDVFVRTSAGSAGAAGAVRVLALHPVETGGHVSASSDGSYRAVVVQFNTHIQVQSSEAVGVTST
jgi:hypothetical protein